MKMMTMQNPQLMLRQKEPLQMLEMRVRTSRKRGESPELDRIPASPLLAKEQNITSLIGHTVHGVGTAPEGAVHHDLTRGGRKRIENSAKKEFQPSASTTAFVEPRKEAKMALMFLLPRTRSL